MRRRSGQRPQWRRNDAEVSLALEITLESNRHDLQRCGDHPQFSFFQLGALSRNEPGRSCNGNGPRVPLPRSWRPGRPESRAIFLDQSLSRPIPRCGRSRRQRPPALRNARAPGKQDGRGLAPAGLFDLAEAAAVDIVDNHHRRNGVALGVAMISESRSGIRFFPLSSSTLCLPAPLARGWRSAGAGMTAVDNKAVRRSVA
jgi:hypothetical protein